jgi:hypothetical protein
MIAGVKAVFNVYVHGENTILGPAITLWVVILKNSAEIRLVAFDKIAGLEQLARPAAEAYASFYGLEFKLSA